MLTPSNLLEVLLSKEDQNSQQHGFTFLTNGENEKEHYTFHELNQRAKAVGGCLQERGLIGKQVLLLYQPGLDYLVGFFGCLYAGAVAVPAYPPRQNRHSSRIQAIIRDAEIQIVLTSSGLLPKLQTGMGKGTDLPDLPLLATDTIPNEQEFSWQMPQIHQDTLAFLQYTSGSTAQPKGVMVTHANLLQNQRMIHHAFGHSPKTVFVGWLPLFHDMGLVGNILQPLWLGIPCVLMSPTAFLQKPVRWLQAITNYKATTSGGPNFAYDLCVRAITSQQQEHLDLRSWDIAFNGSEPIRARTLNRFTKKFEGQGFKRSAFTPCYGLAEGTLLVSSAPKGCAPTITSFPVSNSVQKGDEYGHGTNNGPHSMVSSGKPCPEGKVRIIHPESGNPCEEEQVGEIWIQGPHVAKGYWKQPTSTQEIFYARVQDTGEGPYLRTGDWGFLKDGELYITGRLKNLIIIRGQNHYPHDIEETISQLHPALRLGGAAAFTLEEDGEDRLVIAQEIERTHLRTVKVEEIANLIHTAIWETHELLVHQILFLKPGSLPKTSSGKTQHHECRKRCLGKEWQLVGTWSLPGKQHSDISESDLTMASIEPPEIQELTHKDIEEFILTRLSYWLKTPKKDLDVHEGISNYGLDSSFAITISGELGEFLSIELDPTIFWSYSNIRALATFLHQEISSLQSKSETQDTFEDTVRN